MKTTIEFACEIADRNMKHVLEFGVFEGNTIRKIRAAFPFEFKVFGFDSFDGLPEAWPGTKCPKGAFSTYGAIPPVPDVKFFAGWFTDTLPKYLTEAQDISLVHVDCDLYSSTQTVLSGLTPHIKAGTILVFDEWFYCSDPNKNDHEQRAFYEWVTQNNRTFEFVDFHDRTVSGDERKIVRITN